MPKHLGIDESMRKHFPRYCRPEGYVVLDYKHYFGMFGTPMAWTYDGYSVFHVRVDSFLEGTGYDYGERLFGDDFDSAMKYANGLKALFPGSFISVYEILEKDKDKVPKGLRRTVKNREYLYGK